MSKSSKLILRVIPIFAVLMVVLMAPLFAIEPVTPSGGSALGGVVNVTNNVWSTIKVVVQVAAIAAIVFAGVRYMFASADAKADIKTQTITLLVGAILVFAAVPVAEFVANISKELFG